MQNKAIEAAKEAYKNPRRMMPNTSDGALTVRLEAALQAALPYLLEELEVPVLDALYKEEPELDKCSAVQFMKASRRAKVAMDAITVELKRRN